MNKITLRLLRQERKILIYAVITAAAIILFLTIFYLPKRSRLIKLKSDLGTVQEQIGKIEGVVGGKDQIHNILVSFANRSRELEAKLTAGEDIVIGQLSAIARKSNLEILALRPSKVSPVPEEKLKNISLGGREFLYLRLDINARSSFKNLYRFLGEIENELPAIITVESLSISKARMSDLWLKIEMTLIAYSLLK